MRKTKNLGEDHARLRIAVIVRLQPGHDEVRLLIANRLSEYAGGGKRRQVRDIVSDDVNRAISAAGQSIFDYTLGALWSHRHDDDFAAGLFLDAQPFFERITVRLVHFKREIRFLDPGRVFIDSQNRVFVCDLLH